MDKRQSEVMVAHDTAIAHRFAWREVTAVAEQRRTDNRGGPVVDPHRMDLADPDRRALAGPQRTSDHPVFQSDKARGGDAYDLQIWRVSVQPPNG